MTVYACTSCEGETPAGSAGSSFLVMPDGRTEHFCSNACLRVYANRQLGEWWTIPALRNGFQILAIVLGWIAGFLSHPATQRSILP